MEPDQLLESAQRHASRGNYERAAAEYEKVLQRRPQDARIHQRLGELYQRLGKRSRAVEHFSRAAGALAAGGFAPKAIALYKQVLAVDPQRADAHLRLSELHADGGFVREAVEQLQKAGALYARADDAVKLTAVLNRLVALEPERVGHRVKLAEIHAREGRIPDAVEVFQQAAEVLERTGRSEEHRRVLERLLQLDASNLQALRTAARGDVERGRPERALHRLQALVDANPRDIDALGLLARASDETNQTSRALSAYKALAVALQEQGREREAHAAWEKVLALKPNDRAALQALEPPAPAPPPLPVRPVPVPAPPPLPKAAPPKAAPRPAPPKPAVPERLNAEQIERLLREVDVYLQFGLPEQAEANLKRVFAADAQNLGAFERDYQLAVAKGEPSKVIEAKLLEVIHRSTRAGDVDRARNRLKDLMRSNPDHPDVAALRTKLGLPSEAPAEEPLEFADPELIEEILEEMPPPPVVAPVGEVELDEEGGDTADDDTDDDADDEATTPHVMPDLDLDPFEEIAAQAILASPLRDVQRGIPTAVRSSKIKDANPLLSPAKVRALRQSMRPGRAPKATAEPPEATSAKRRRTGTHAIAPVALPPPPPRHGARRKPPEPELDDITEAVEIPVSRRRSVASMPAIEVTPAKRRLTGSHAAVGAASKRRVTGTHLPASRKSKPSKAEKAPEAAMREYLECAVALPHRTSVGAPVHLQIETRARADASASDPWLAFTAARGDRVRYELGFDGLRPEPKVKQVVWRGREGTVDAVVEIPNEAPPGVVPGWALVSVGRVPVGRLRFDLIVRATASREAKLTPTGEAEPFRKAYLAFVEADRVKAQACATALKKHGVTVDAEMLAHDVEARWKLRAAKRIGECEILVLLWSEAARKSAALSREWMLALGARGESGLVPVRLSPGVEPPAGVDPDRFEGGVGYFGED